MTLRLRFDNEIATENFAKKLSFCLQYNRNTIVASGLNIRLTGNLAAGKTTLTRALLRALGVTGRIKSPTFELVSTYDVLDGLTVNHFDFYRFEDPSEFDEAGFRDLYGPANICISEWSERATPYLPQADLEIFLEVDALARDVTIEANTTLGQKLCEELR